MEKTRKYLYSYAKERYLWEHTRKNELNSSITIPLGIMIVQISGLAYFFINFPKETCNKFFIIFIVLLCLSSISLILSIVCFFKHQIGYKYVYIQSPQDMENYCNRYIAAYTENNDDIDYKYIINELRETELSEYIKATENNILNNETKIKRYRYFLLSLIITTVLLVLTLFINIFLDKNLELIRVIIENTSI